MDEIKTYTVFHGHSLFVSGTLEEVLPKLKDEFDQDPGTSFLIFEDQTGKQVDFDLRGRPSDVLARARAERTRSGPGRPKLGVISREVTLLPRHWEWLEKQPNGASASLRRLVEEARKHEPDKQRRKQIVNSTGRFLSAIAGDFPGYEEASRALYAHDLKRFEQLTSKWPVDVRRHALRLLHDAL
jgi:hypothetical protein